MSASSDVNQRKRLQALEYCDELLAYHLTAIAALAHDRDTAPLLQQKQDLDNSISAYQGVVERLTVMRAVLNEAVRRYGRPPTWTTP